MANIIYSFHYWFFFRDVFFLVLCTKNINRYFGNFCIGTLILKQIEIKQAKVLVFSLCPSNGKDIKIALGMGIPLALGIQKPLDSSRLATFKVQFIEPKVKSSGTLSTISKVRSELICLAFF